MAGNGLGLTLEGIRNFADRRPFWKKEEIMEEFEDESIGREHNDMQNKEFEELSKTLMQQPKPQQDEKLAELRVELSKIRQGIGEIGREFRSYGDFIANKEEFRKEITRLSEQVDILRKSPPTSEYINKTTEMNEKITALIRLKKDNDATCHEIEGKIGNLKGDEKKEGTYLYEIAQRQVKSNLEIQQEEIVKSLEEMNKRLKRGWEDIFNPLLSLLAERIGFYESEYENLIKFDSEDTEKRMKAKTKELFGEKGMFRRTKFTRDEADEKE